MKKCTYLFVMLLFFQSYAILEVDLRPYELRLISQYGEDGILQKIFDLIGTTNKYYVEFGAGNGHFCSNTKYLREKYGWNGLLFEGSCQENSSLNLHRAFITAENICELFAQYNVPQEFDLISIDIDGNDFYVWQALSEQYRPRVVVIECNHHLDSHEDKVVRYDPSYFDNTGYSGASVLALYNLGRALGYSFVYHESAGINLFFVRDDILAANKIYFKHMNNVEKLYNANHDRMYLDPKKTNFISSKQALKDYNNRKRV